MRIGAHLSVSSGYDEMIRYAEKVGCECAQIFAKSPRRWAGAPIDMAAAKALIQLRDNYGGLPLFTHTAYLINLATPDEDLGERSVDALADELVRGGILAVDGVITHLGNDPAQDARAAAYRVATRVALAYERAGKLADDVTLLLENTSGAGSGFGCCPDDIGAVFAQISDDVHDRIRVCIDTCHAHAYGTDLSTPEAWEKHLDAYESACGVGCVKVIHANDCKFERGSKRDRHAWIGEGRLGVSAFEAMVCVPRLDGVSIITEMPGEVPQKDAVNIARLKAFRSRCKSKCDS